MRRARPTRQAGAAMKVGVVLLALAGAVSPALAYNLTFDAGFTPNERDAIDDAHAAAVNAVEQALSVLESNHGRIRYGLYGAYQQWFGEWTPAGYQRVVSVYEQVLDALQGTVHYHDARPQWVYAYTYPGEPGDTWLGSYFWLADEDGFDSQFGTIVHEATHWYWTGDLRLYLASSHYLASLSWNRAVQNANNYEYFVEDLLD